MKKQIILIFIALFSLFNTLQACPICGCGGGNLYMGVMPDFQHHFIGIRYHYAQYHTQLFSDPTQHSNNYYNAIELWGGFRVGEKIQILAFVPYYQNKQVDDDGISRPAGLGDITVIGQYQVFRWLKPLKNHRLLDQQLWLGGGLKAPTGSFNVQVSDSSTTVADINAQLGTGSLDFLLNGTYSLKIGKFGLTNSLNYKINTINGSNYKYGNVLSENLIAYYRIPVKKNAVSPNGGIGYESVAGNVLHNKRVEFTGSHVTTLIAGIEYSLKKWGIGCNAQLPVAQDFAGGQTKLKLKAMMHVTVAF
jgi:hypothetical protein